jgi:hypothetical protein
MKVPVREEKRIEVRQTSTDFETTMAPILLMYATEKFKVTKIKVDEIPSDKPIPKKQLDWHQVFTLLPIALQDKRLTGSSTNVANGPTDKTVEIKFDLPSLDVVKQRLAVLQERIRKLPKKILYASAGGAIVLASLIIWASTRPASTAPNTGSVQAPTLHQGTPSFSTILPAGENINHLGGWVRISPPKSAPVYTYVDHINGVQVDVSEQQLPPQLQSNTASQLYQVAQNFGADSKLTAGDSTFYIGTNANDAQSVILAKDNLLLLMKSVQIVPNDKWMNYINSMQ